MDIINKTTNDKPLSTKLLLLLILSLTVIVIALLIGICALPSIGKAGLLHLLSLSISILIVSVIFAYLFLKSMTSLKNHYNADKNLFKKNVLSTLGYITLRCLLILNVFFIICIGIAMISTFYYHFMQSGLKLKIIYIMVYGIFLLIPCLIFKFLRKYWKERPKFKREMFSKVILSIFFLAASLLLFIGGALNLYTSTLDLFSGQTKEIIIADVYVKENHTSKGGPTYKISGIDENGKQHSFNIEKKQYNSLKYVNKQSEIKAHITCYVHSEVLISINIYK